MTRRIERYKIRLLKFAFRCIPELHNVMHIGGGPYDLLRKTVNAKRMLT
jgi:hypothetical protein